MHYLKVGELSKTIGLTKRTLRFYNQIGLLSPSGKTESGHRLYNDTDLSRLQQILSLKELGLSLEEIKAILDSNQISPLEIVNLQIIRIKKQIKEQQYVLDQLEHVSKLMANETKVTAKDFTNLLQAMKIRHEKIVVERQKGWEYRLDVLGDFLTKENEEKSRTDIDNR